MGMHEIAALEIAEFTNRLRDMSFAIVIRFSFEEVHAMHSRERFLEFCTVSTMRRFKQTALRYPSPSRPSQAIPLFRPDRGSEPSGIDGTAGRKSPNTAQVKVHRGPGRGFRPLRSDIG